MKIAIFTLALTCLGQSYEKVTAGGKDWTVFTPPKVGVKIVLYLCVPQHLQLI